MAAMCGWTFVGAGLTSIGHERSRPIDAIPATPKVHPHIAAIGPTQARKRLRERREPSLRQGIVFVARHERADEVIE